MGKIRIPPEDIKYRHPKAVMKNCTIRSCKGYSVGKIIGRAMEIEHFSEWGDYMRTLDLLEWQKDEHHKTTHKELRFCQYYRKAGGTDNDWFWGQSAGHMSGKTFYRLIRKAKTCRDYGTFEGVFDKLINK